MFYNQRQAHEELQAENKKLQEENRKLRNEKREDVARHNEAFVKRMQLSKELKVAKAENEKFQKINDELITRLISVAKKVNRKSDEAHALAVKEKELEQQAKYTAELRSYVSSLHEKVRKANVERKHHEERAKQFQDRLEALQRERKSSFDSQREKAILNKRVTDLYNAIDKIDDIVSEVI